MSMPAKDERRSPGGLARAKVLTPEQRSEIAQKAARARWGEPGSTPRVKSARTGKLKGVPAHRELTVTTEVLDSDQAMVTSVITEHTRVVRIFTGQESLVQACVKSYLNALQDIGMQLTVHNNILKH